MDKKKQINSGIVGDVPTMKKQPDIRQTNYQPQKQM